MEEDDLLKGWKKTQPKKTPIFKPADFPYFRIGVDNDPRVPQISPWEVLNPVHAWAMMVV
jgi:hypothetical protein